LNLGKAASILAPIILTDNRQQSNETYFFTSAHITTAFEPGAQMTTVMVKDPSWAESQQKALFAPFAPSGFEIIFTP